MNQNKTITQLDVATEIKNEDIIPIVQDGTNKQITKEVLFAGVNDSEELNEKFNAKADKATTLKGYGITDAYTKKEVDAALENIDLEDYYTKEETDMEIVFSEEDVTDRTKVIIDDEEMNTMGTEITNEKTDSKFLGYSANYLKDKLVCVSPTEPENGEEVWVRVGKNLINPNTFTEGFGMDMNSGQPYDSSEQGLGRSVTTFIEVTELTDYIISGCTIKALAFYNKKQQFISGLNGVYNFITPTDTKYIRFAIDSDADYSEIQMEIGAEATEYEPYMDRKIYVKNEVGRYIPLVKNKVHTGPYKPYDGEEIWIQKSNNKLKFDDFTSESNGITFSMRDQVLQIGGTATAQIQGCYLPLKITLDKPHVISARVEGESSGLHVKLAYTYNDTSYYPDIYADKLEAGAYLTQLYFIIENGKSIDCRVMLQLEEGTEQSEWHPYVDKKIFIENGNGGYEEFYSEEGTGWIDAELTSDFTYYNSTYKCQYRKIGKMVAIQGVLKPTGTISMTDNAMALIFTLPEGFRPSQNTYAICQGSGINRWLLTIDRNGEVYISRYGITEFTEVNTGTWLPFNITFTTD